MPHEASVGEHSVQDTIADLYSAECHDKGFKLQSLCLKLWSDLENTVHTPPPYAAAVVDLLQNSDYLDVVQLVIPELRAGEPLPSNLLQRQFVADVAKPRAELRRIEQTRQEDFDRDVPFYGDEKRIFGQAELFRAGMLLYNSGYLEEDEKKDVMDWLDKCPVKKPRQVGAEQTLPYHPRTQDAPPHHKTS